MKRFQYRKFIQDMMLIDEPKQGKLVPFIFNKAQNKFYDKIQEKYDIEGKGLSVAIRIQVLKARREGFSSVILALFAADDIHQSNPTETQVLSYKDEATKVFTKRYKLFIESAHYKLWGITDPKQIWAIDNGNELVIKWNSARFFCGTASARTGGRGGVLQKVLFTEAAFYPDTEKMTAKEIIDGTLRQVDINSGWAFIESTANGYGNYYELLWTASIAGMTRFWALFFGWREMYTEEEYALIASEFIDKGMLKQEYPEIPEDAFIFSGSPYFDNVEILRMIKEEAKEPLWVGDLEMWCTNDVRCPGLEYCKHLKWEFKERANGKMKVWEKPVEYSSYVLSADVSEGIEQDYCIGDMMNNRTMQTVATFADNTMDPGDFGKMLYAFGMWYNKAYLGCEVNKDGLYTNDILVTMEYPNLHFREEYDDIEKKQKGKVGFRTSTQTRPFILSGLLNSFSTSKGIWVDKDLLDQALVFVKKDGKPQAMSGKHDDRIITKAIGLEIRNFAPKIFQAPAYTPKNQAEENVLLRLAEIKRKKHAGNGITQGRYV